MIEIAPEKYWINCTYDDAIIYCQFLEINGKKGFRNISMYMELSFTGHSYWDCWYSDGHYTNDISKSGTKICIPVRDRF